MAVKEQVLAYFHSKGLKTSYDTSLETLEQFSYLDSGLIDSMGIIEMIMEFEETFQIHFDSEHLQSQAFQTMGGLIQLISQLQSLS